MRRKIYLILGVLTAFALRLPAQEYNGMKGLLQVPSAETDSAGTFRGNAMFLHREFLPEQMPDKNTMSYVIGITPFRWIDLSYGAALLWMHRNANRSEKYGYYNEDRRVNVKLTPLYEGRWWPAIAVGMDDIGRFKRIKDGNNKNNYFQNIYLAGSKHFDIRGWQLGAHLSYRYYASDVNRDRRGVAGGVTLRPAFFRPLRFIAEWDGVGVNAGADVLLWRHLFVQASVVHGQGFAGGMSYHYTIRY